MTLLHDAYAALLAGLTTKTGNEINWEDKSGKLITVEPLDIKISTYIVRYVGGDKFWYLNDKLHREDGPAAIRVDGTKAWCINGEPHREDGHAIEYAGGDKYWFLNGKLHREDGPAVVWADGTKAWFLNGKHLTEEEFNNLIGKK
jgi:hypothetical protein